MKKKANRDEDGREGSGVNGNEKEMKEWAEKKIFRDRQA